MNISEYAVKRPIIAVIIIAAISLIGPLSISRLPLLFLPEFDNPFLMVTVAYRSTSPSEVEKNITIPVEGILGGIKHLKNISSTSSSTGTRIRLEFEIGTDMDLTSMEVRDRLDRIKSKLPDDIGNMRVRRWQTTDMPIIRFGLAWSGSQSELNAIVERIIQPKILRLEGVADVDIQGIAKREILVELDDNLMESHGATIAGINQSLKSNNLNLSGGSINDGGRKFLVRAIGEFSDFSDISLLPIRNTSVRLADLGTVSYSFPERRYYQRLNHAEAVTMSVFKSSTANVVDVAKQVKEVIKDIKTSNGMEKLTFHIFFDQSVEILESLAGLHNAGIIGGIMAVAILFLFLFKLRSTLIIAMAIPISVLCTFTLMFLLRRIFNLNITLNIISLSGLMLAVGMLVDNSVVVLENIYRHKEEGEEAMAAAIKGAGEVGMPVFAATLTTIIVFVPLLFTAKSSFGRFLGDFGLTIVTALVASLFVALTLIPLIASRLFTGTEKGRHRIMTWLVSRYTFIVSWTTRRRMITITTVILILGGGIFLFTQIEREFVPQAPSRQMDLSISLPRSYEIQEAMQVFDQLETILLDRKEELEISMLSSNFRAVFGRITIFFNDIEESKRSTSELRDLVRELLPEIAGVSIRIGRGRGMGGGTMGMSVDLMGPDSELLSLMAEEVKLLLEEIPGVEDVDTNLESGDEEIRVSVNREKAAKYGLSPRDVAQVISSNLSSTASSSFKTMDEEIAINVQLKEEDRATLEQLKQLRLDRENSGEILLGTIVNFSTESGSKSIQRERGDKIISVSANTDVRGMRTLRNSIEEKMAGYDLAPGYAWQMGQSYRRFQESEQTSQFAIILAVVFVYLIMASLFESLIHPITILFSVPFSIIGVALLFYLTGTTLNSTSWLGMMVLFGIVVNNGIILVDHINRLRIKGMSRDRAIVRGGQNRLRPILMTASTTILGLVPMVAPVIFPQFFGPIEGRANMYGPIALALVGGLITSTFLTLIITPTIYSLIDDLGRLIKRIIRNV